MATPIAGMAKIYRQQRFADDFSARRYAHPVGQRSPAGCWDISILTGQRQLIIDGYHAELAYENRCLILVQPGQPSRRLPLSRITKIICLHSISLSTQLLGQLQANRIDFVHLNQRYSANSFCLQGGSNLPSTERRLQQYAWCMDPQISRAVVLQLLKRKLRHSMRHVYEPALLEQLKLNLRNLYGASTIASMRGIEGASQRLMYQTMRQKLPTNLGFTQRLYHPAPDPVNAALSLTFSLVYQEAIRTLISVGLDPTLGFLHVPNNRRFALACDVMEVARPYVEAWVCKAFMAGTFTTAHFSRKTDLCLFKKAGREIFYPAMYAEFPQWQRLMRSLTNLLRAQLSVGINSRP